MPRAVPPFPPGLYGLDVVTDLSAFVQDTLWVVAVIIAATAVMVYALAYLSRYFEYLKMQESKYLDAGALDFIHRVVEVLLIGIWALAIMAVAAIRSVEVRGLLVEVIQRVPAVFFAILALFVGAILVRALRQFGAYLRGELPAKPRNLAPPRLWGVTELFLKYLIIVVSVLVAFVGAVDVLPASVPEKSFLEGARNGLTTPSSALFTAIAIAIAGAIVTLGIARFSDSVFDDMKQRSKKYGPKVLDQFKFVARTGLYGFSFITVLFLVLGLFLTPEQLIAFAVAFLLVVVIGVAVSFDAVRNAAAGLALMQADPYSVGDRVKIGEDLVGDVTGISLTMTSLRTGRGETVTLPNREVLATPVLNFTRSEHHPIFLEVAVGWDVPHKTVEELLLEAAKRTPGVLENPPPQVFGKDVAGNAIVHQLLAFTNDPEQMKQVKSALLYTVQDLFHDRKLKVLASPR